MTAMNNQPIENPPAFPNGFAEVNDGMTLRDYFAAKALQVVTPAEWNHSDRDGAYFLAKQAYQFADAMLAARSAQ